MVWEGSCGMVKGRQVVLGVDSAGGPLASHVASVVAVHYKLGMPRQRLHRHTGTDNTNHKLVHWSPICHDVALPEGGAVEVLSLEDPSVYGFPHCVGQARVIPGTHNTLVVRLGNCTHKQQALQPMPFPCFMERWSYSERKVE